MSYQRGDFGIEYSTSQRRQRRGEPGVFAIAAMIAMAAVAVCVFAAVRSCSEKARERPPPAPPPRLRQDPVSPQTVRVQEREGILASGDSAHREPAAPQPAAAANDNAPEISAGHSAALADSIENGALSKLENDGSARTRVLVRRLAKLNESRDLVAAIATLEELRAIPEARLAAGDFLARRLGELNMELLLSGRENKWTAEVPLGQGYTLQRLAYEHGTTVAALMRLNAISDPRKVRAGRRLRVLEHPKFQLLADARARTADLYINRRFFKRYKLLSAPAAGEREVSRREPASVALRNLGVSLSRDDREELLMFLSPGSIVRVE